MLPDEEKYSKTMIVHLKHIFYSKFICMYFDAVGAMG